VARYAPSAGRLALSLAILAPFAAPAAAQKPREPVVMIGLRPTKGGTARDTEIRRLGEAQRLREIAGGVLRVVARRPIINHISLREQLGGSYLVDFVDCSDAIPCVARVVAAMRRRTPIAVLADYHVERGTYQFRFRVIDLGAAQSLREVEFALEETELEDRKLWQRELGPLFADLVLPGTAPAEEETAPEEDEEKEEDPKETKSELPELAPITSEGPGEGGPPRAGEAKPSAEGDAAGDESSGGFVDDSALDAVSRGVPWHGHFQNYAAVGARGQFENDILIFDNRLQLEFESTLNPVRIVGKPQLLFDWLQEDLDLRFREVFAARYYEHLDISVGERILTWGITDFWPVVDIINPRDFTRIENWRPIDEKLPVPVVQTSAVFGPFTLHLLAIPLTRNSQFQLDPDRAFALPIPELPGATVEQEVVPTSLKTTGGGASLDLAIASWKISAHGLWGRNPTPTIYAETDVEEMTTTIEVANERVVMGGLSLQGDIDPIGVIFKAEGVAYRRIDDRCKGRTGDAGGVPECFYLRRVPTARTTVSIERNILPGLDAHLQYINEITRPEDVPELPPALGMLAPGFPEQERSNPIMTLRLQGRWLRDDLRPMAFAYWSLADEDFFVNTDIEYHVADGFALAVGGFLFQGYARDAAKNRYTFAGSLESSSNAYLRATAWF
jgi:hypothetical protein